MTVEKFLAWFEGYTEHLEGDAPTPEQWKRIKSQIQKLTSHEKVYRNINPQPLFNN